MSILLIAQATVPVALILSKALAPPRSASGFGIQVAAVRLRQPSASALPVTPVAWVVAAVFTALGVASAYAILTA